MEARGESLVITKAEARALLAFAASPADEERRGPSGVVVHGSELAATDGARAAVLGIEDGTSWRRPAYEVPRETWESAIRACPGKGVLVLRMGEIAVLRSRLDAELVADADAAERSRLSVATLEFDAGEAVEVEVSHAAPVHAAETWAMVPGTLSALVLVGRACEMPAIFYAPSAGEPMRAAVGAWWCSFSQVTGEDDEP